MVRGFGLPPDPEFKRPCNAVSTFSASFKLAMIIFLAASARSATGPPATAPTRRSSNLSDGNTCTTDRVGDVGVSEADRDGFEGKRPSPWNLELRHNGFLERTKTAMGGLAENVREQPAMPRFEDGSANLRGS